MSKVSATIAVAMLAAGVAASVSAPASAAPAGKVDPGAMFSSVNYGTGCSYSMTVPVNSSGLVSFWDWKGPGYPPLFVGRAKADGAEAAVTWTPRFQGVRRLYATQNGRTSPITYARVTQGYGSGGSCFAFP